MINVLYVDDEVNLLEITKLYLEITKEFTVTTTPSASAALDLLQSNGIQAIVSDYQMPEMDGIEFLKRVRATDKSIPFIIFTGKGREEIAIEAFENGADFYLQKGGEAKSQFAELAHKINKAVEGRMAEERLTRSQIQLAAAMDLAHIVNWEYDVASGIFTFNDRFYALYGTTAEREGGYQMPAEVYAREFVHPDEAGLVADEVQKAITTTDPNYTTQIEHRIIRRDGRIRHIIVRYAITKDAKGNTVKTHGANQDITELKRAGEALRKERNFANSVIETAQAIVIVLDSKGHIVYFNPYMEGISGYILEEVKGKDWFETFLPPHMRKSTRSLFQKAIGNTPTRSNVDVIITKDGRERLIEWNDKTLKSVDGSIEGLLAIGQDVTDKKKADEEIQRLLVNVSQEKEKLSALINSISDEVWFADAQKRFTLTNPTACREFCLGSADGPNVETLAKKLEVLRPDGSSRPVDEAPPLRALAGEVVQLQEEIVRTPATGELRYRQVSAAPVRDEHGTIIGSVSVVRDITELKRAEEALQVANEKYSKAFLSAPDAITISELDSGQFIEVNDAATRIFGYSRDELIGKNAVELGIWLNKEDRDRLTDEIRKHGRVSQFEVLERRKSGEQFNALVNGDTISIGNITYLIAIIHDITNRKKAEQALREGEERLELALNVSQLGTWDLDLIHHTAWRSLRHDQIFGYDSLLPEWTYEMFLDHVLPLDRLLVNQKFNDAISHQHDWEFECRILRKDGKIRWIWAKGRNQYDPQGAPIRMLGLVQDITDRKQMEEKITESESKSRSLLEHVPELILVHRNGLILYTNPAAVKTLGYQPHEAVNKQVADFIAPEFHERVAAAVRQRMSGNPVDPYEIDVLSKDGNRRNMIVNGGIIDFDGAPASLIILVDITDRKKAEDALKRSEARFRAVVEDQTEFICRFAPDGRLTFVNPAYCRYFGLDKNQCLAHPHLVVLPPEDARLMREHLTSLTPENPVATIEHRIIMPSGEVRWQRWNDRAIFDGKGTVIEYQSVGRDFTDKKMVENALHESDNRFRQIAESAGDWIWEIDAGGMYTYSNATVYPILGYTPEEIVGKKHFYDLFVPEDRGTFTDDAFRVLGNRQPFKILVNTNMHKNGDRVILETSGLPIFDSNGTFAGYRGVDTDITARKKAEEAARESERLLTNIVSFLPDATLVIDKNGTVLAWNRAMEEMSGVPAEQMIGKADYEYALPFYHERRPITIDLVLHEDPDVVAKYPVMKREGRSLFSEIFIPHFNSGKGAYLWFTASPLFDAAGNITGAIESIRDITERKREEEALVQANKQLNLLSSITRHDIKNQVLALRGYIELSRDRAQDPKALERLLDGQDLAARTIEEQISFTKDYQEMGAVAPVWQNVNECIKKAMVALPMRAVHVETDSEDPEVYADPLFERVFYNLFDNTLHYGGDQMNTIRITSKKSDQGLIIIYEDNGVGITAADKKKLFRKGFGKHTGLGLFLSREILSITGITITENGEPGKGARFEITVPKGMWRMVEVDKTGY